MMPTEKETKEGAEFLKSLDTEESLVERKGRHYVEGEVRFATVAALAELSRTVTTLALSQAQQTLTLDTLNKSFSKASTDVEKMKVWMEGTTERNGTRTLGVLDHITTFKRWKNWVLALLSAIAVGQATGVVLGFLNHAAVTSK